MGIDVPAAGALDRVGLQVLSDEERLHFAEFERSQDTAKSGDAAAVSARFTNNLLHQFLAAGRLPLIHYLLRVTANLIASDSSEIGLEPADERLTDVGMHLRLKHRELGILAGKDPLLKDALLQKIFHSFGDVFEVLPNFIFYPALSMAPVVTGKSIAAAAARQGMKQILALGEVAEPQVEYAGTVTIDEHDPKQRMGAKQMCKGLQIKLAPDKKLGTRQQRG
jgi:hypothetical protein